MIILAVANLRRLETQCSRTVVNGSLGALVKRFYGMLGDHSLVARIGPDQFAAIVEVDGCAGQNIAREAADRLSSRYSVQENGIAQNIAVRVNAGIVDRPRDGDRVEFYRKFQQMTGVDAFSPVSESG